MHDERRAQTPQRVGAYVIERRLGKGGMSEVHLARDEEGRRVAIKHVPAGGDPSHRSRLRREARTTARVEHEAAVAILDVVEDQDGLWLVLEYVDGITLADEIAAGRLPPARALDIAAQITGALATAHDAGILHRDLKSENVMLTPDGRVRLLDFGLAKALWSEDESQTLTLHGEVMGTCRAMSPEQARGWRLDGRSDLFALGSLLYEMVTGVSPFQAKTPVATMNRVCTHEPPPAHLVESDVPKPVSQLIAQLHRKKAADRPESASAAEALIQETIAAIETPVEQRWPAALLPTVLLLVALLGAGLLMQRFDRQPLVTPAGSATVEPSTLTTTPLSSQPETSPVDALVRALNRAGDAEALERIRERALSMLERYELRFPEPDWDRQAPPIFLADTCRVIAAIDFELAAPDAALRWLDVAREVLLAQGLDREGDPAWQPDRDRLAAWPDAHTILPPMPPFANCDAIDIETCAPIAQLAHDLESSRRDADLDELDRLIGLAGERGLRRLELKARLERIRLTPDASTAEATRQLVDEAELRGLQGLIDALQNAEDPS